MPIKKNPLKLNKLQLRTLALSQVLARETDDVSRNEDTGEVTLLRMPHVHGNHVHIGQFTVSSRDASGFSNPAVWKTLARKKLIVSGDFTNSITLTADGISYDTGHNDQFITPTDH